MDYNIQELNKDSLHYSPNIIRNSFLTVANEFHLTKENASTNGAFMEDSKLFDEFMRGVAMFGLFVGRKQVGFVAIVKKDQSLYYIEKLSVLPEYRHCGYGEALLNFSKDYITQSDGKKISIGVIYENKVLLNWYEQSGFRQTEIKKFEHLPFTVCLMEYIISA